jgi:hypothetical protein
MVRNYREEVCEELYALTSVVDVVYRLPMKACPRHVVGCLEAKAVGQCV